MVVAGYCRNYVCWYGCFGVGVGVDQLREAMEYAALGTISGRAFVSYLAIKHALFIQRYAMQVVTACYCLARRSFMGHRRGNPDGYLRYRVIAVSCDKPISNCYWRGQLPDVIQGSRCMYVTGQCVSFGCPGQWHMPTLVDVSHPPLQLSPRLLPHTKLSRGNSQGLSSSKLLYRAVYAIASYTPSFLIFLQHCIFTTPPDNASHLRDTAPSWSAE